MRILDQSVESRAEVIVTEKSALFTVKKVVKTVARTAVGYVHFSPKVTTCIYNHMMSYRNYFHPNYSTTPVIPVCHGSSNFFFRLFFFLHFFPCFQWCQNCWKRCIRWSERLRAGYRECWQRNKEYCSGRIQ